MAGSATRSWQTAFPVAQPVLAPGSAPGGEGFIKKYVALIDAGKVGLGLLAYVNIRLNKYSGSSHAPMSDFARDVQLWPEVVECYAMSGTWTICCVSRWLTWRISPDSLWTR